MARKSRFKAINGRELRTQRLARGWTQRQLGKASGYSDRLVRKAEQGGTLDIATIQDLAEALTTPDHTVLVDSLTMDIASIARKWVESFDGMNTQMLQEIGPYLHPDFIFNCPGKETMAPFVGIWKGLKGHQQWLDAFFGFFERSKNTEVHYTVGVNSVHARWVTVCTLQGVDCAPVRINMHFRFVDGLIHRIDDEYDTHAGDVAIEVARATRNNDSPAE